jgi:hypothetical protein
MNAERAWDSLSMNGRKKRFPSKAFNRHQANLWLLRGEI